tara:strand:- start:1415 stop:1624 length:210 start_codon:yes stop_codon:yes gene_type:complete
MSNHVRIGDKVFMTHHMSNKGLITEVFYRSIGANIGPGTLSKQMFVKFRSELTGQEVIAKRQDVTKDNT